MNCLSPINIYFKRPLVNHVTGEIKTRGYVPCGRCSACLERRRLNWFVRLREEHKISKSSYFITLTYDDFNLPCSDKYESCFDKRQVQLFLKRLRTSLEPKKFRYYLISEYGTRTYRPHYHFHYFGDFVDEDFLYRQIRKCWPYGLIHIGRTSDATLNYVCGHVQYIADLPKNFEPPFTLMSRRPGLGFHLVASLDKIVQDTDVAMLYSDGNGRRFLLPRYYRERLYKKTTLDNRSSYIESTHVEPSNSEKYEFERKIQKRKKLRLSSGKF